MLEGKVVCNCFGVTEEEIERVVRENSLDDRRAGHELLQGRRRLRQLPSRRSRRSSREVRQERQRPAAPKPAPSARLTNIQKIQLIEETIEREIRPAAAEDGGDIELIDVDGNRVIVSFRGMCAHCHVAQFT